MDLNFGADPVFDDRDRLRKLADRVQDALHNGATHAELAAVLTANDNGPPRGTGAPPQTPRCLDDDGIAATLREAAELLHHPYTGVAGALERTVKKHDVITTKMAAATRIIATVESLAAAHEALLKFDSALAERTGGSALGRLLRATEMLHSASESVALLEAPICSDEHSSQVQPTSAVVSKLRESLGLRQALLNERATAVTRKAIASALVISSPLSLAVAFEPSRMSSIWAAADQLGVLAQLSNWLVAQHCLDFIKQLTSTDASLGILEVSILTPRDRDRKHAAHAAIIEIRRSDQADANAYEPVARMLDRVTGIVAFFHEHVFALPSSPIEGDGPSWRGYVAAVRAMWEGEDGLGMALVHAQERSFPDPTAANMRDSSVAFGDFAAYQRSVVSAALTCERRLQELHVTGAGEHECRPAFAQFAMDATQHFAYLWRNELLREGQSTVARSGGLHRADTIVLREPAPSLGHLRGSEESAAVSGALGPALVGLLRGDGSAGLPGAIISDSSGSRGGRAAGLQSVLTQLLRPAIAPAGGPANDLLSSSTALPPADFDSQCIDVPTMRVTVMAQQLCGLAQSALEHALAAASAGLPQVACTLLYTCGDVLLMYPLLVGGGNEVQSDAPDAAIPPATAAVYYNDCVLLGSTCLALSWNLVSESNEALRSALGSSNGAPAGNEGGALLLLLLHRVLPALRSSAVRVLVRQVRHTRADLLACVPSLGGDADEAGFEDEDDEGGEDGAADEYGTESNSDDHRSDEDDSGTIDAPQRQRGAPLRLEAAFRGQVHNLKRVASSWGAVLPRATFTRLVGHLADACVARTAGEVLSLPHISEPSSRALARLMRLQAKLVTTLPLWSLHGETQEANGGDGGSGSAPALLLDAHFIDAHVPHWRRHTSVAELLELSLASISQRVTGGDGYAGVLSRSELAGIVQALFQQSGPRDALIKTIRQMHY